MKKILLAWNGMESDQVSGGDLYTSKLVKFSKEHFDIILSENAKKIIKKSKNNNLFVTDENSARDNIGLINLYFSRIRKSINIIKTNKRDYNLGLSSSPFIYDLLPIIFSKSDKKAVILFHIIPKRKGVNLSNKIRFILAKLEQKISFYLINKYFDTIFVGNKEVEKEVKKIIQNKHVFIADAGIETKFIDKVKEQKKDENLGIFVGRLTVQKGILDLVDIAKEIEKENPRFKLIVIGDGPDKKQLLDKIEREKTKSVRLMGFIDKEKKYEFMKKAKFFLFPSYEEGWGIALAEALYCNCLCFCYELPYYQSVFSNYPIYVKLGDKKEFTKKLLEKYKSKTKNEQKKFIKQYDDKIVIKKVLKNI